MPIIPPASRVLVTGANGFLGSWITKELLDRGFLVRGTVRTDAKGEQLKAILNAPNFEYTLVPDIAEDGAFDNAVKDVDGIIHTATPVLITDGDPDLVIGPAVKGTRTLLESAKSHGNRVKRVVVTSSISAVLDPSKQSFYKYTETDWNETSIKEVNEKGRDAAPLAKYDTAKALAERAVWEFAEANKSTIAFDCATVQPGMSWGPFILPVSSAQNASASMNYLWNFVKNPNPDPATYTELIGITVSTWDIAKVHIEALLHDDAAGHRFMYGLYPVYAQTLYDIINRSEVLKAKGITAPKGNPGAADNLPPIREFDSEPARSILKIDPSPIEEAVIAALLSFVDIGLLP